MVSMDTIAVLYSEVSSRGGKNKVQEIRGGKPS